jgi:hypothetical protein
VTAIYPPGQYVVTVKFDGGTDDRVCVLEDEREEIYVMQLALIDMRMSAGPGLMGKVESYKVEPYTGQPLRKTWN